MSVSVREFHVGDLLSVTSGRLVSLKHIGGVYEVVDFVTGQAHMTHQLPRACDEVKPWLLGQHPWLADVVFDFEVPKGATNDEALLVIGAWLTRVAAEHGAEHPVEAMPFGMYVGRDPIAEIREMAPHAQIIAVEMPSDEQGGAR